MVAHAAENQLLRTNVAPLVTKSPVFGEWLCKVMSLSTRLHWFGCNAYQNKPHRRCEQHFT